MKMIMVAHKNKKTKKSQHQTASGKGIKKKKAKLKLITKKKSTPSRSTSTKKSIKKPGKKVKKVKKVKKTIRTVSKKSKTRVARSRGKKVSKKKAVKKTSKSPYLNLERSEENPIISPTDHPSWESKATFNPTAFHHDGKVHIVYRAIGEDDSSALGYAASSDGYNIDERLSYFIYKRFSYHATSECSMPKIDYISGGGWSGGCEDPRLTLLDDTVYLLYTAFDGWGSVRIALSSISLDDFISKRFNWKKPVFISPPGEVHKNWVLFPGKVRGRYAILHSMSPEIMVDYFDSLDELDGNNFIHSVHRDSLLWGARDRLIRGIGPAPIKTKYGWLVLYHKMEKHDSHRYKLWAMILDTTDPTKVLYRSESPILEPDFWYENEGYKGGVVYSCGAVVKNGELFVYYGGADRVSCVATAPLDKFLAELVRADTPVLDKKKKKLEL
jgi:beta-1,2-mannobiose phosphorylase / 1,2-beta-oligomannan phosphorylase